MKIIVAFGTRPEAVKLAPVIKELQSSSSKNIELNSVAILQHKEILWDVIKSLDIQPDYVLDLDRAKSDLNQLFLEVLKKFSSLLRDLAPDLILVQGDTTTALASALAAFHLGIKVGHIEAGLRTYDKVNPYPEEINRQLISRLADWNFCPTELSKKHLVNEMIDEKTLFVTGNTVIDSLFYMDNKITSQREIFECLISDFNKKLNFDILSEKFVLITGHRREAIGAGLKGVCHGIAAAASIRPDIKFVFPVHPNPLVRELVFNILGSLKNIKIIDPLDYTEFLFLMKNASLIVSDSGGIQEEAPSFGVPVLITRLSTERPEAVSAGKSFLVGYDAEVIKEHILSVLEKNKEIHEISSFKSPFGDGTAAKKIRSILERS